MHKIKTVLIILIISFTLQCSSESEFFDPTYWSPYKGITFTDEFGLIFKTDESDWCEYHIDSWDSSGMPIVTHPYAFLPAYPNPVDRETGTLIVYFLNGIKAKIKILVNDSKYKTVIILADSVYVPGFHGIEWDLRNQTGQKVPGGVYRCYMYAPDFTCNGDIWVK